MEGNDENNDALKDDPIDTAFRQQRMAAVQPVVTPAWVVGLFMTVGVLFVPLGTWLKLKYADVVELTQQYEGSGTTVDDCSISEANEGKECQVKFSIDKDMKGPVYVYFELRKFYQNHRSYVKSRSFDQLKGGVPGAGICSPLESIDTLDLNPCGLVANSMFNDVIVVDSAPEPYESLSPYEYMDESGISWVTDRDGDFSQPDGFVRAECAPSVSCADCLGSAAYSDCGSFTDRTGTSYKYWYPDEASTQYLYETYPNVISPVDGVTDEHFVVWMRTAALSTFRNLYGRIEHDLVAPAEITFNVTANFHVAGFGGTKSLVLTTLSPVGSRNGVLGGAFMAVGGACLAAGVVVLSTFQKRPREFADASQLESS
ncbi:unnamed protein product [Ectocarpus sp. 6 AP-2014]